MRRTQLNTEAELALNARTLQDKVWAGNWTMDELQGLYTRSEIIEMIEDFVRKCDIYTHNIAISLDYNYTISHGDFSADFTQFALGLIEYYQYIKT